MLRVQGSNPLVLREGVPIPLHLRSDATETSCKGNDLTNTRVCRGKPWKRQAVDDRVRHREADLLAHKEVHNKRICNPDPEGSKPIVSLVERNRRDLVPADRLRGNQ